MENVCIRVRFSPLMKNISKNNSKCCLEIVPLVTCIENIDKIKWKHKKDKIEYIVPMNYKIIIKKLNPNKDAIKMYYSCVDLLPPSSLSNVNINAVDIYSVTSDNIIMNKKKTDLMELKNTSTFDTKLDNIMHFISKSRNPTQNLNESLVLSDSLLTSINMSQKHRTGSVQSQTEKNEATKNIIYSRDTQINTYYKDKSTSTVLQNCLKITNRQKCIKNYQRRKFCITPIYESMQLKQPIIDYSVFNIHKTNEETSSIASANYELDILKNCNNRPPLSSPYRNTHDSVGEDMILSNIRIQPEVRVAKFVEKLEKEIMPLKIIFNNIVAKCASLGLNKNILSNKSLLDVNVILGSHEIIKRGVEREKSYNRVVYSVVFDE